MSSSGPIQTARRWVCGPTICSIAEMNSWARRPCVTRMMPIMEVPEIGANDSNLATRGKGLGSLKSLAEESVLEGGHGGGHLRRRGRFLRTNSNQRRLRSFVNVQLPSGEKSVFRQSGEFVYQFCNESNSHLLRIRNFKDPDASCLDQSGQPLWRPRVKPTSKHEQLHTIVRHQNGAFCDQPKSEIRLAGAAWAHQQDARTRRGAKSCAGRAHTNARRVHVDAGRHC